MTSLLIQFLPSSLHGALFCICTGNSVATAGLPELLLSSACTASGAFLLSDCPSSEEAGGAQGSGRGHSRDS